MVIRALSNEYLQMFIIKCVFHFHWHCKQYVFKFIPFYEMLSFETFINYITIKSEFVSHKTPTKHKS